MLVSISDLVISVTLCINALGLVAGRKLPPATEEMNSLLSGAPAPNDAVPEPTSVAEQINDLLAMIGDELADLRQYSLFIALWNCLVMALMIFVFPP